MRNVLRLPTNVIGPAAIACLSLWFAVGLPQSNSLALADEPSLVDVSSKVQVSQGSAYYDRLRKQLRYTVTLKNTSTDPILIPVALCVSNLPAGVSLVANSTLPGGTPCVDFSSTVSGGVLLPGASSASKQIILQTTGPVGVTPVYAVWARLNQAPTADAGPDQTVTDTDGNGTESVTLDGSGSTDPDGTIVSYVWTEGGNQIATGVTATVSLAVGSHTITLTVTDNAGATATDQATVTVNAGNRPPTADAGPDQTVTDTDGNGSESVTLDGSGSTDPDGTIVGYVWTEGGNQIATGMTATVSLAVGSHTITLTVTDNAGATATDQATVTVNAGNRPPTADAGPDQTVTDTDGNGSEVVTLDGSASTDPDGTIVSYVWTEGGNQIATGMTATVSLAVAAHLIDLTVTDDDGATASDQVLITVNAGGAPTLQALKTRPSFVKFEAGQKQAVKVLGVFSDESEQDLTAAATGTTYTSSDPGVATASADGVVTGVTAGFATITIQNGAVDRHLAVLVGISLESMTITPCPLLLNQAGDAATLQVSGAFSDAQIRDLAQVVDIVSTDPAVVQIGPANLVEGQAEGSAELLVSGPGQSELCSVAVGSAATTPLELRVSPNFSDLTAIGETVQLTVTGIYTWGEADLTAAAETTYTVQDARVAAVTSSGLCQAVGAGATGVLATYRGVSDGARIRVNIPGAAPFIQSISPTSGGVLTQLTIEGAGFSSDPASNIVSLNGVPAEVLDSSTFAIRVTVPADGSSGPLTVTVGPNTSNPVSFDFRPAEAERPSTQAEQDAGMRFGECWIGYKTEPSAAELVRLNADYGLTSQQHFPRLLAYRARFPSIGAAETLAKTEELVGEPNVQFVFPALFLRPLEAPLPFPPVPGALEPSHNPVPPGANVTADHLRRLGFSRAWRGEFPRKGNGADVLIIDNWFDTPNPMSDNKPHPDVDFVQENVFQFPEDPEEGLWFHGTAVAGVLAGKHNTTGVDGIAPGASVYAYQIGPVMAANPLPDLMLGIGEGYLWYADRAVNASSLVVNLSVAIQRSNWPVSGQQWQATIARYANWLVSFFDTIKASGFPEPLFVCAAGNDFVKWGGAAVAFPACLAGDPRLANNVIAVGATESSFNSAFATPPLQYAANIAPYSQRGPELTVLAPGNWLVLDDHVRYSDGLCPTVQHGTSFAAPVVSGLAALIVGEDGGLTPRQIKQLIINRYTIDLVDDGYGGGDYQAGRDDVSGWGLVSMPVSIIGDIDAGAGTGVKSGRGGKINIAASPVASAAVWNSWSGSPCFAMPSYAVQSISGAHVFDSFSIGPNALLQCTGDTELVVFRQAQLYGTIRVVENGAKFRLFAPSGVVMGRATEDESTCWGSVISARGFSDYQEPGADGGEVIIRSGVGPLIIRGSRTVASRQAAYSMGSEVWEPRDPKGFTRGRRANLDVSAAYSTGPARSGRTAADLDFHGGTIDISCMGFGNDILNSVLIGAHPDTLNSVSEFRVFYRNPSDVRPNTASQVETVLGNVVSIHARGGHGADSDYAVDNQDVGDDGGNGGTIAIKAGGTGGVYLINAHLSVQGGRGGSSYGYRVQSNSRVGFKGGKGGAGGKIEVSGTVYGASAVGANLAGESFYPSPFKRSYFTVGSFSADGMDNDCDGVADDSYEDYLYRLVIEGGQGGWGIAPRQTSWSWAIYPNGLIGENGTHGSASGLQSVAP